MNQLLPGISQRLAELTRSAVQLTGPVSPLGEQLPDFQPGERYTAQILQNLQDGKARAQVAGQLVTLQLPQGAREGSTVTLTHVGRNAQTLIATMAPDSSEAPDSPVELSQSARTIGALLDRPPPAPARLAAGQPLIEPAMTNAGVQVHTETPAPVIAGRLATAIGQSGLFYESHQAQWVSGERTIESTAAEPQRNFDPVTARTRAPIPDMAGTPIPANISVRGEITDPVIRERTEPVKPDAGPPAELRPLVQNQLLGLSQHTLAWEGLAWPGQMMKIEIDDPHGDRHEPGSEQKDEVAADVPWTSRLRLVLPGLGEVETSLTLWRDHGLALNFSSDPEARLRMGAALMELQQRMTDAGLRLGSVSFADVAAGGIELPAAHAPDDGARST
jgi:hypothetical protein